MIWENFENYVTRTLLSNTEFEFRFEYYEQMVQLFIHGLSARETVDVLLEMNQKDLILKTTHD